MGLTSEIGEFVSSVRFDKLPPECIKTVCTGFTDCVAVIMPGWVEPVSQIAAKSYGKAIHLSNRPLQGVRASAPDLALIYATAAHALDYDDTGLAGHPSAILVSAILAEASETAADGKAMIAAYVAGYETWAELVRRDNDQLHAKGWHPTCMFGALAAAAASASLRRLNATQASQAVAMAASFAGGIVGNFGTMTKPLQVGRAAQSGLLATRLVEAGMTSGTTAIEDDVGFLRAVSPKGEVDITSPAALGKDWAILHHGVNVKLYPMCYCAHRVLDAAIDMQAQRHLDPNDIQTVTLELGDTETKILRHHRPKTGLEAKFSGEFAAAAAVIAGQCGRAELTDGFVQRTDVQGFIPKVRITSTTDKDPEEPAHSPFNRVRMLLRNGQEIVSEPVARARGHFKRPVDRDRLWRKFSDCASHALDSGEAQTLFDMLQDMPQLKSASDLGLASASAN
jgi:2-methylcitrate dehydratase PrpD